MSFLAKGAHKVNLLLKSATGLPGVIYEDDAERVHTRQPSKKRVPEELMQQIVDPELVSRMD